MIVNRKFGWSIKKSGEVTLMDLPERIKLLRQLENNEFDFKIPEYLKDNQSKQIYKVGFLRDLYTEANPRLKLYDIYEQINNVWQVFLSRRQMDRLYKSYVKHYQKQVEK